MAEIVQRNVENIRAKRRSRDAWNHLNHAVAELRDFACKPDKQFLDRAREEVEAALEDLKAAETALE